MHGKHTVRLVGLLTLGMLSIADFALAGDRAVATFDGVPLEFLVNKFNLETAENSLSTIEPKLTVDEVVASIYAWQIKHRDDIDDATFAIYKEIAETRKLPKDATLVLMTRWQVDDREFDVWWINLEIKTGEKAGYGLRVRECTIKSRPFKGPGVRLQIEGIKSDVQ